MYALSRCSRRPRASGSRGISSTKCSISRPWASSRSWKRSATPWKRPLPELSWLEILLRVSLAAGLGGAIGIERELREREAGLRTHMLVSVGAALFTLVSAFAWTDWQFSNASGIVFDPTRIAAQIVTGIGFLGAGAIIRQGLSVRGLTTGAPLWVVAAIGMATGAGFYSAAIITTVLVLISLYPLRVVAYRVSERIRPEEGRLAVGLAAGATTVSVLQAAEDAGAQVRSLEFEEEGDTRRVDMRVRVRSGRTPAGLIGAPSRTKQAKGARWTPRAPAAPHEPRGSSVSSGERSPAGRSNRSGPRSTRPRPAWRTTRTTGRKHGLG